MAAPSAARRSSIDDRIGGLLHHAAVDGCLDAVKAIIMSLGIGDGELAAVFYDYRVLHKAAYHGHLEVCKYLVEEHGADVNMAGPDEGVTPLMVVAMSDHISIMMYLLDHGADPMKPDEKGSTALHHTAGSGSSKVTEFLLSKGMPADIDNNSRGTPLISAINCQDEKTMKILLDHHANPNMVFIGFGTPPIIALLRRSVKCMKLLIKKGSVTSPLIVATEKGGFTDFIRLLLEAGADPNIPDYLGRLPIELAALNDCTEEVEMLFPLTLPIPDVPNWGIDGVISHAKLKYAEKPVLEGKKAKVKSEADKAFRKKDYEFASSLYGMAAAYYATQRTLVQEVFKALGCGEDAAIYSNRSLCKLKMGDGAGALLDANQWRAKDYKQACDALLDAKKWDPGSDEIERELRRAMELMKISQAEAQQ